MRPFKIISEISENLAGKKVLVRVDFNIPDDSKPPHPRIIRALPTIVFLRGLGAKIILVSHRDKAGESLQRAYEQFSKLVPSIFVDDFTSVAGKKSLETLQNGEVALLENIRRFLGEEKNDLNFAKTLASLADVYVNEAFSVSHRKHASIVGVPKILPGYAGTLFANEFDNLLKAISPEHLALAIVGGAKFSTKLPVLNKFLETFDNVFIGGALMNSFFRAKNYEIGNSVYENPTPELVRLLKNPKLILPIDVVLEDKSVVGSDAVKQNQKILDVGPESIENLKPLIGKSKMIVWNGPLGEYEKGFLESTLALAKEIVTSSTYTIVGGGDTIAVLPIDLQKKFSFVSMAGGAMLDFIALGTLPGIEALKKDKNKE